MEQEFKTPKISTEKINPNELSPEAQEAIKQAEELKVEIGNIEKEIEKGDKNDVKKSLNGLELKLALLLNAISAMFNPLHASNTESTSDFPIKAEAEKTISVEKPTSTKTVESVEDEKVLSDFSGTGGHERGENKEKPKVDVLDLSENFKLGVGDLNMEQSQNASNEIYKFVENLSQEKIRSIISGETVVYVRGEASHENIKPGGLVMEDGTKILNNEELARYRAMEISRIFIQTLVEKGYDVSHIKVEISYPKGGVSEKDHRVAQLELHVAIEKSTKNILEAIKDNIIAGIRDKSGSIDPNEAKIIDNYFNKLEKDNQGFQQFILEGKDLEAHLKTLEHIFYHNEKFKSQEGTILLATDEPDASWYFAEETWKKYAGRAESLMKKYKESGKIVLVQIFNPNGDGSFKVVNLTENPLALQIKAHNKKEYQSVVLKREGIQDWYNGLNDDSDIILDQGVKGLTTNIIEKVDVNKITKEKNTQDRVQKHKTKQDRFSRQEGAKQGVQNLKKYHNRYYKK